jgi:serine O-acetyltransferase
MKIESYKDLLSWLYADSKNYNSQTSGKLLKYKRNLFSDPISDQKYIWKYIKNLRYTEYHMNMKGLYHKIAKVYYLSKLRKLSYKTGFQIPPNTCGPGLTIWHWGSIIINPKTKIGSDCTLYPGVLLGHKKSEEDAPVIGNNVFLGSGSKIIGPIVIGNNVVIGQNCVVTHDIPSSSILVTNNTNRFINIKIDQ